MFILDFDDTLFDTHAFKHARLAAVGEIGVSEDLYWETYKEARNTPDGLMTYSDVRHAQAIARHGFSEETVLAALQTTTGDALQNFLAEGTLTFLTFLKAYNKPMVLLSLGMPSFQELKVRGAGIHDFFDRVFFVDREKLSVLRDVLAEHDQKQVWLVNDKVTESQQIGEAFPDLNIILRQSKTIDVKEYEACAFPWFATLQEIQTYVKDRLD